MRGHGRRKKEVSILVLMEVLREAGFQTSFRRSWTGFNPCFNGSVERGTAAEREQARYA